jgi:hypothetical protein
VTKTVTDKLAAALGAVDWNNNVAVFLRNDMATSEFYAANFRLAVWSRQFELVEKGNPALCFIREMQIAGQNVVALTALALYKAAASSMRSALEGALYYSYFRTHHSELATLVRDPKFYVDKKELLDYHKDHTVDFIHLQGRLGLISRLDKWYSDISRIIHGQVPGAWVENVSLADIRHMNSTLEIVVRAFVEGVEIIHRLFLCTTGRELWDNFSSPAKKKLLSGLPGDLKEALKLDAA